MKKEQMLLKMSVKGGSLEILGPTKWKTVEDVLAEGWQILQMVSPSEGLVLLLLEREKPGRGNTAGSIPFGGG